MNHDPAYWSTRLIFASMCILLGTIGFVTARSSSDRRMTFGLLAQGILLAFLVGGTYFRYAANLRLGGMVVAGLLVILSFASPAHSVDEQSETEEHS